MNPLTEHMTALDKCAQNCITVRSDAIQTISSLIDFFSMFSLLEDDLNKLKTWQSRYSSNAFEASLEKLVQVWNQAWPSQRDKLIAQEHWLGLNHFIGTKDKLDRWMSQKEPPSNEVVFAELSELLNLDCYNQWHEVAQIMQDVVQTGAQPNNCNAMPLAVSQSRQTVHMSL